MIINWTYQNRKILSFSFDWRWCPQTRLYNHITLRVSAIHIYIWCFVCRYIYMFGYRTLLTGLHKALTWIPLKICGVHWWPGSMLKDHQIWRSLKELPKKNGLGFLRRCTRDLLQTTTNNCMMLSSKKDTQLTISTREANNFDPGSFWFLWNNLVSVCKVK